MCPIDARYDCPYLEMIENGDMTCEECEVCKE